LGAVCFLTPEMVGKGLLSDLRKTTNVSRDMIEVRTNLNMEMLLDPKKVLGRSLCLSTVVWRGDLIGWRRWSTCLSTRFLDFCRERAHSSTPAPQHPSLPWLTC